jgi:hypothetical protein
MNDPPHELECQHRLVVREPLQPRVAEPLQHELGARRDRRLPRHADHQLERPEEVAGPHHPELHVAPPRSGLARDDEEQIPVRLLLQHHDRPRPHLEQVELRPHPGQLLRRLQQRTDERRRDHPGLSLHEHAHL